MNPQTTEQIAQLLGTLVTMLGLLVVAPYHAGRFAATFWERGRAAARTMRAWLSHLIPGLRIEQQSATSLTAAATISARSTASASAYTALPPDAALEHKVEALLANFDALHNELGQLADKVRKDHADTDRRLEELEAKHSNLKAEIRARDARDAEVNARGFPLATIGALPAGAPFLFPSWWALALLTVALALVTWAAIWPVGDTLRELRAGITAGWRWNSPEPDPAG